MSIVGRVLRKMTEANGYFVRHNDFLPFGIDYLWDIQRLAVTHGIPIRCAFDIGAHGGNTASEFLTSFPEAEIFSFEPHPNSFSVLRTINSDRLHPQRLAISNKAGPADFFVLSEVANDADPILSSANNSLVANRQFGLVAGPHTKTIKVDCETVDRFCSGHSIDRLDLLKIDTEGHEVEVLDGAKETLLHRQVRFVFVEFETMLPVPGATGGALAPVAERLEPLGFRFVASYPVNMLHKPFYAAFNALFFAAHIMFRSA